MHAKSFVGPQAHSHGPLCMQALQGSTPLVVTPPSRQTRNLARASRETPSPPIALEVGIELLDTRASLPRLPRPLSLCKKKSLRTREREGGRAHHRICPLKSTFGWLATGRSTEIDVWVAWPPFSFGVLPLLVIQAVPIGQLRFVARRPRSCGIVDNAARTLLPTTVSRLHAAGGESASEPLVHVCPEDGDAFAES